MQLNYSCEMLIIELLQFEDTPTLSETKRFLQTLAVRRCFFRLDGHFFSQEFRLEMKH